MTEITDFKFDYHLDAIIKLDIFYLENGNNIKVMESLKDKMEGAILHSFRNSNQFLEVEFSNDTFEEIIFFIDCKISSSDNKVNKIVNNLNALDKDVADIAFFIPANNKKVINVFHKSKTLEVAFINGYSIYFHLYDDYGEPLSISFRRKKNEDDYDESVSFGNVLKN